MIYLQDIPHQKVYRLKTYLPKDDKAPSMYNVIFSNNKTLDGTIKLMKHPLFVSNHKYLSYYLEYLYRNRVGMKTININYRQERQEIYDKISEEIKMINTPLTFEALRNKNVYYDMHMQNKIFFSNVKNVSIKKKIELYFDYIQAYINNPKFDSYKNKVVMIDINDWMSSNDSINNPIMYIYLSYRKFFELFAELGDIDIIFYTDDMILRINPNKCTEKSFSIFKRELNKLVKNINIEDDEAVDKEVQRQDIKDEMSDMVKNDVFHFTGDETGEVDDTLSNEIDNTINDAPEEMLTKKEIEERLEKKLEEDGEILKTMHEVRKKTVLGKSTASLKRDEELREKQKKLKVDNMKIEDYTKFYKRNTPIESNDISSKINTTNENVKTVKFANFEKSYNKTLMKHDMVNILTNLNDKSVPVFIKDIKVEDTSDELNYKETYTVLLEDGNRVRHTLKFDMPKFIEDKFLYLGGNKKIIVKQLFMKPIVKTGPETVQICSNYNKIFIERYGSKLSSKVERFKKALSNTIPGVTIERGDSSEVNMKYKSLLEYDEISKTIMSIKTKDVEIIFDQKVIEERLGDIKLKADDFCIGFYPDKKPIIISHTTERIGNYDLIDFIVNNCGDKLKAIYDETKVGGKRYAFSRAIVMKKHVPIILFIGYCEGLSAVLKKANIEHYFTDKRPSLLDDQGSIQFADGYLVYNKYPYENSLLLNALETIPTKSFEFGEFDEKDVYIELFEIMYGARNLGNAFDSFYEFMIDPITKEVLEDLDYPTDFVSVVLFANALLADNSYIKENNMNLYRVRSNEIVNAFLHKQIANAYSKYRATAGNKNPVKISIPRDAVIKEILTSNIVEEFSTLNPVYETEKLRAITPKGPNGLNVDDAYTQDKRSYDNTMLGLTGMSTSPDANVGVVRQLSMEPGVISPRGYIDIRDNDVESLKDVNMFTTAEMLTPLGVTRDDSVRTAMASKQSKHMMPVEKASPVLISNGSEKVIQYNLSKDFIVKAKDNGEVAEIDEDTGIVMIKYTNGEAEAIDINPKVVKNSASGFYVSNKLQCDLKVGQKVKKDDILAYENKFFSSDSMNGNRFNIGSLQKVAIMSSYSTFEDSTFITKKMSKDMASDVIMMKDVVIGKNSNVDKMVSVGDEVSVGDILVSFDTSYDDEDGGMNKFLASVGDELQEDIKSLGKVPIKSKYSGTIVDIKMYSSVDLDELSPSLKKILAKYYTKINKKKKVIEKYDKTDSIVKAGLLFNETTGKITPTSDGKIKGREVFDGVLIEFYIQYRDPMGVGDKLTFFSALKSIVGEVVDEGYEPFSEFRPEEEISTFIGPSAILQRMVPSVILTMFGNKVLIELKKKLQDIYES